MTLIFQPILFSSFCFLLSLVTLPSSFLRHHSLRVFGIRKSLQFLCPCQKQPWTKITVLYFGRTMSGLPGSFLFFGPFTVKRSPSPCRIERTMISGFVSLLRIRDIFQERCSVDIRSINCLQNCNTFYGANLFQGCANPFPAASSNMFFPRSACFWDGVKVWLSSRLPISNINFLCQD